MKRGFMIVLTLALALSLTACGDTAAPAEPLPPANDPAAAPAVTPDPAPEVTPEVQEPTLRLEGDSYWVAYEREGDMRQYTPDGDDLLTDLTLWADGTARIREIEGGTQLLSGADEQNMTWTCGEDGALCLYAPAVSDEPYWTGTVSAEGIELSRFGGRYRFRQEAMPEGGNLYSPAELKGVWMITFTEIEGDQSDVAGEFSTLVFELVGEDKTLVASAETGGGGYLVREDEFSAYQGREVTVLDQNIYTGCGNDEWSVRIGEESPLNEHDLPENVETYVTLLDQNTLLQQRYFSFDEGRIPGVSYQTYKRVLPQVSAELEKADLTGKDFKLAAYTASDGTQLPTPFGINGFNLRLESDSYFFRITGEDGFDYAGGGGYWEMGRGGTLHMTSEANDEDWLSGAAQMSGSEPEIFLWYDGGIMRLEYTDSGEWSGYVDTMTDIEGRAFEAPEGTLCVLYNENYTDMSQLNSLRCYEIDEGSEARYVLVTSALDDTYFWLNEDGYCREDFGTVHAGESFVIKIDLPESGGYLLEMECSTGAYCFELNQSIMEFYQNWNYLTI